MAQKRRKRVAAESSGGSATAPSASHRERILKAAMILLAKGGRDALTTRAVAEAARVQPPVLYRLFEDKAGLLHAVADYGFGVYMLKKRPPPATEDPVASLRTGWKLHVEFGLAHPELYLLMYADAQAGTASRAAEQAQGMLRDHMQRVAAAGRLRVGEERAAQLFHAAACGVVMTLLGMPEGAREMSLSEDACDAALAAIVTEGAPLRAPRLGAAATTLRAQLVGSGDKGEPSGGDVLTEAERGLLLEWLDRLGEPRPPR